MWRWEGEVAGRIGYRLVARGSFPVTAHDSPSLHRGHRVPHREGGPQHVAALPSAPPQPQKKVPTLERAEPPPCHTFLPNPALDRKRKTWYAGG